VKTNFHRLAALALFTLALHAATFAQSFTPKFRAQIPFAFYAGEKLMQPGNYVLAVNSQNKNVELFDNNSGHGMFLLGSADEVSSDGRSVLIFHVSSQGVYSLQEIQGPDIGVSFKSVKASSLLVKNQPASDTLVLVAQAWR
jgi:hypothetical protein